MEHGDRGKQGFDGIAVRKQAGFWFVEGKDTFCGGAVGLGRSPCPRSRPAPKRVWLPSCRSNPKPVPTSHSSANPIALGPREFDLRSGRAVRRDPRTGGLIVGRGQNCVTSTHDPTAHAEVVAIRAACAALRQFHLSGATLYTSCEPCPMCLAAAYWAHVGRIVYAGTRDDAAAIGFDDALLYREIALGPGERRVPMVPGCCTRKGSRSFANGSAIQSAYRTERRGGRAGKFRVRSPQ